MQRRGPDHWLNARRSSFQPQLREPEKSSLDLWSWAERLSVIGLFCLALGYTTYLTQGVLVPIILAWVVGTILLPLVDVATRWHMPRSASVILISAAALITTLGIIGLLSTPLTYWIGRTSELGALLRQKMELLSQPLALLDEMGKALAELSGRAPQAITVDTGSTSIIGGVLSVLTPFVSEFVLFFFAMIFYLLYQREIKTGIVYFFSGDGARIVVRNILDDAERNVSRFFGTLFLVNVALGAVTTVMTWAVGLPHPLLWGVLAGVLNFIPYIGPAVTIGLLLVIGLISFATIGNALIAPLAFLVITTLEGQVITPTVVGHRLTLNPFLIFLFIAFWTWMWGPVGAFLAVPLLISAAIVVRHLSHTAEGVESA
ncbi:MAG: AI-2E family transporter [Hyphomicrobiaceae bacterium]